MGKRNKKQRRARPTQASSQWWILGIAVAALTVVGSIAYFSRPGVTAGPHKVPVTQIEHAHGLAVDPFRSGILWIGTHGSLIRVTDGKSWHRIGPQTYDMMGFNVHPAEPNVLLTSGHPGI